MEIRSLSSAAPFTTKDGSVIRSILDLSNAPVAKQSLAEATIAPGASTQRHRHPQSEEFYLVTQGAGLMEIDGEKRQVGLGEAILIPAGAAHQITCNSAMELKLLCCCAPPYRHEDTELL